MPFGDERKLGCLRRQSHWASFTISPGARCVRCGGHRTRRSKAGLRFGPQGMCWCTSEGVNSSVAFGIVVVEGRYKYGSGIWGPKGAGKGDSVGVGGGGRSAHPAVTRAWCSSFWNLLARRWWTPESVCFALSWWRKSGAGRKGTAREQDEHPIRFERPSA